MTAIKTTDIDRFIAKPDISQPVVLVYGPDAGLVRERVDALVRASVDDPNDPFALARIESEELSANPGRLADEANTVPLFGGRRAVLLRVNSRHNIVPSIEVVLEAPPRDCRIVVEAGELRKTAPLRALFEKAKAGAAIGCYPDNERDLARLIDEEMRAANLTLAADARAALTALIGGDRLASRNEIRKLALYAQGKDRIELADVMAVVADASEQALDGVIDATFAGETREVEDRIRQGARRRIVAGGDRLGGDPPGRQSAQDEAFDRRRRLDRFRHDARRPARALHAEETGRSRAAYLDAAASVARHGAARRSLARHAAQRGARRGDRATHAAVDRGERAA